MGIKAKLEARGLKETDTSQQEKLIKKLLVLLVFGYPLGYLLGTLFLWLLER